MDTVEIKLKMLTAGELQRLACDMLALLNEDWGTISKSGGVEGTNKTRKGTPDAWCERNDNSLVYIQATGDPAKGKILEDLNKSINQLKKLNKNNGALCIAFLSFDPQSEEIEKCKSVAKDNNCEFQFYSNAEVSQYLKEKYPELLIKYSLIESNKKVNDQLSTIISTIKDYYSHLYKHFCDYSSSEVFLRLVEAESNESRIIALNGLKRKMAELGAFKNEHFSYLEQHNLLKNIEKIIKTQISFNGTIIDLPEVYTNVTDERNQTRRINQCINLLKKIKKINL